MLKNKQLNVILKALENSSEHLEGYLDKHKDYLCSNEINKIMEEIEEYKNTSIQIECIIGSNELSEYMKSGGLTMFFPSE